MINSRSPAITLPEDLIAEVLSLLTVKSLSRLKCVSNSWNSLISDPFFVKMHLHKSSQNTDLTLFSAHYSGDTTYMQLTVFPAHTLLENHSTTMVIDNDTILALFKKEYHEVVGSCNGLCCLMQLYTNNEYQEFSLRFCNPATRSLSHKLGSFRISADDVPNSVFKFSFGYDNLTDKYKVVAFRTNEVRVFTLGNNVWRNIQCFPINPSNFICSRQNEGLYLSNCLIWFADRIKVDNGCPMYVNLEHFVIISLNLGTEKYTELLPPQDLDEECLYMPNIWVLMECLCFSYHSNGDNFVIWQMRDFGVEESWTKLFSFCYRNLIYDPLSYFGYNRLLLLDILENSNTLILANPEGQVIRYDRRDNRVDPIRIYDTRSWFYVHSYVESLVSIC